jgi:hypothetical protein
MSVQCYIQLKLRIYLRASRWNFIGHSHICSTWEEHKYSFDILKATFERRILMSPDKFGGSQCFFNLVCCICRIFEIALAPDHISQEAVFISFPWCHGCHNSALASI